MRIIFMGTPDFAAASLSALISQENCEIVAVYSQPARPAGRGKKEKKSPVQILAEQHKITTHTPISLKSNEEQQQIFKNFSDIDYIIVAAYGLLLPDYIINEYKCLNIHASLLPRWRGAAPIQRAIQAGDDKTGITIMHMDEGLDTGDMLLKREINIDDLNSGELHDKLSDLGAKAVIEAINTDLKPEKQGEGSTYAKKLKKEEALIDWNETAITISRKIRAFNPFPAAYFVYKDEKIKILQASYDETSIDIANGTVIDKKLSIACEDGTITPEIVQRAGKKPMKYEDMLRGYEILPFTKL